MDFANHRASGVHKDISVAAGQGDVGGAGTVRLRIGVAAEALEQGESRPGRADAAGVIESIRPRPGLCGSLRNDQARADDGQPVAVKVQIPFHFRLVD